MSWRQSACPEKQTVKNPEFGAHNLLNARILIYLLLPHIVNISFPNAPSWQIGLTVACNLSVVHVREIAAVCLVDLPDFYVEAL